MKKSDKKIDNQICQALTIACESAKDKVAGFQWLTHFVDYNQFPGSLSIVCIFDTKVELELACQDEKDQLIVSLINTELQAIQVNLKQISQHISFYTEEACQLESNGKWPEYFRKSRLLR